MSAPQLTPILILANCYPPENLIGALRPARIAQALPDFGYDPYVITASPQPPGGSDHVIYTPFRPGKFDFFFNRTFFPYDDRIAWIAPAVTSAEELHRRVPFQAVWSTSPPVADHLVALELKKRFQIPWIADFRDPIRGNSVRTSLLAALPDTINENQVFANADLVVCTTNATAQDWRLRHPQAQHKIRVVYNGYDASVDRGPLPIPARDHKILIHAGSIYYDWSVQALLKSVDRLIATGKLKPSELKVRFVGETTTAPHMQSPIFYDLIKRDIVSCGGWVPRDEAYLEMAQADFLLMFDPYRKGGSLQLAAKVFEYVKVGRPILSFTTPGAPAEEVLTLSGIPHVCIYHSDPEPEMDRKLVQFLQMPSTPVAPTQAFVDQFNGRTQTGVLADCLDALIGRSARMSPALGNPELMKQGK
jgi:glycosyltransferase involved in cell wall biosynthesis